MTQQQFPQLASNIRKWINDSGQEENSEIRQLCDDLEQGSAISRWAAVNFERVLPFRVSQSVLETRLRQVRNLLVFLPIALTWLSIMTASTRFDDYVRNAQGETVNFLVFWESQPWLEKLSTVAGIDAVLIFVVIVLTATINFRSASPTKIRRLENLHNEVMIALERELAGFRYLSVADLHMLAQSTVDNLANSSKHVAKAAASMDTMADKAGQATTGLENLIRNDFTQIGRDFASSAALLKTIGDDQRQLSTLVASVNSALSTSVTTLNASISTSTQKVSDAANELTSNFESVAKELQSISRSIELSVMHLKNDLDELKKRISR
jgi:hypothetical protein